jgi:phosphoribosylformylglycinamidine synthase
MVLASIDECVRNLVCAGADPSRIAILDNFCWPSCDKPSNMGALVRASAACYAGAKAYRAPFVSGKDSLSNQLRYTDPATGEARLIEIPFTLLVTGMAIVPNVRKALTTDAKQPGNHLLLVQPRATHASLGASLAQQLAGLATNLAIPRVDLDVGPKAAACVAACIQQGHVRSAHDCSEGGLLVALAEMLIGAEGGSQPIGADVHASVLAGESFAGAFHESPTRYVLEVSPQASAIVHALAKEAGLSCEHVATLTPTSLLRWQTDAGSESVEVAALTASWRRTLDW